MMIRYVLGDLMKHPGRFILQGCNAQGVMGSGVAKVIRDAYPRNFDIYRKHYEEKGLRLGDVIVADCGRFVFLNGITQEFYGKDGRVYVDYGAIRQVIMTCSQMMRTHERACADWNSPEYTIDASYPLPLPEIAMPLIGAGLAGGDWVKIANIIQELAVYFQPVVYIKERDQYEKVLALPFGD